MTDVVLTRKSTIIISGNKIKVLIAVYMIEKTVVKFYSSKVFFLTNPFIKNVLPGPPKFNFKTTKRPAS